MTIIRRLFTSFLVVITGVFLTPVYADSAEQRIRVEKEALTKWVVANSHDKIDLYKAKRIVDNAYTYAARNNLDPLIVLSIMRTESGFREKVTSSYGAKGIMQVVPRYHADKLKGRNAYELAVSIEVGTRILRDCLNNTKDGTFNLISSNCYSGGGGMKYYKKVTTGRNQLKATVILARFANEWPLEVAKIPSL